MRVLVVNDDPSSRNILRLTLVGAGYTVLEAETRQGALDQMRAAPDPLVVLLDFTLARWNTADLMRAIAADPLLAFKHAYVLMVLREETMPIPYARALAQMTVLLVPKPFSKQSLLDQIAQAASRLPPPLPPTQKLG